MADFKYTVTIEEHGEPLKSIVKNHFAFSSRLMTKLRQQELILVNGKPLPGWVSVKAGDEVTILMPEEKSDIAPENIPIYVTYEDSDILVLNKQPGHVVHPTKGKPYHTIANGVMYKMLINAGCKELEDGKTGSLQYNLKEAEYPEQWTYAVPMDRTNLDESKLYKIRFVNRLDMNTSGLLIIAKNSHSQDNLEKQMQSDTIQKKYLALVEGIIPENTGTIDKPIGRPDKEEVERWILPVEKGGFESITHFNVIERFYAKDYPKELKVTNKINKEGYTLVELRLETGRTHQIRVHLSSIGYPIVGDHLYCHGDPFEYRRIHGDPRPPKDGTPGPRETNPEVVSDLIDRQALHAYCLDFDHPTTGERLHLEAELPEDMKAAITGISPSPCPRMCSH